MKKNEHQLVSNELPSLIKVIVTYLTMILDEEISTNKDTHQKAKL